MKDNVPDEERRQLAESLGFTLAELEAEERAVDEWQQSATPAEIGEFKFAIRQELRRRRALMN
jgi:hypothetical protein